MSSPVRGGWRGAWSNKDTTASPGPTLPSARCPGWPPKWHPSCAATPELYCRDTRSLPVRACAWPHPRHAASLWGEKWQSWCELQRLSCGIGGVRGGPTVFVLLHLHAAIVDTLDAAQASHLFVNAEILDSTAHVKVKRAVCVQVNKNVQLIIK